MYMITRGYVLVSHPLDNVHDAVLETCNEMKAEVKDVKRNSDIGYQIEIETASRFGAGQSFQIRIQDKQTNTLIEVYDDLFHPEKETKFIFPFFRCLAKHIRLDSGFRIYPVEAPTNSLLPTYALAEHNRKLWILPTLLEGFHYNISIIDDSGIAGVKKANILAINTIGEGNLRSSTVLFKRGDKVLLTIPIRELVEVATSHLTGRIRKGNDFVLEFIFNDSEHDKKSIVINVDDKYVNYIQLQISAIKDSELGINKVVWGYFDKLCTICTKNKPVFGFSKENICTHCFGEKYGKIALPEEKYGEYHGGHKVHLLVGHLGSMNLARCI